MTKRILETQSEPALASFGPPGRPPAPILLSSEKGGTGKSTIALMLADWLSLDAERIDPPARRRTRPLQHAGSSKKRKKGNTDGDDC